MVYDPGMDGAAKNPIRRSSELARAAGVSTDTLRHYERKGLLKPRRSPNGYRAYDPDSLDRVRLIRRALSVGFKLDELARVLSIRDRGGAPCREVRALAATKLESMEAQLRDLTLLRDELRRLLATWDRRLTATPSGKRAHLLDDLAETGGASDHAQRPATVRRPKRRRT